MKITLSKKRHVRSSGTFSQDPTYVVKVVLMQYNFYVLDSVDLFIYLFIYLFFFSFFSVSTFSSNTILNKIDSKLQNFITLFIVKIFNYLKNKGWQVKVAYIFLDLDLKRFNESELLMSCWRSGQIWSPVTDIVSIS